MADLGNLFFRLGIKDEDAQKILDRLEKRLVQDGYKIKLRAPNASEFLKDLQQQLKQQTLDVKVRAIGAGTTGAATTPSDVRYARMMEVQQRMANAATAAQQRLINARNADARAAERHTAAMNRNNMTLLKANTSMSNQSRLLSGLRNQILDVYSIYTMERFLTSVIEIGGEFQKQHIALNAMLGDTAKADVMFGKIKELAVESPFNFRELMGFTKQIAAFGIPYEEMYETTKRLADISAGLGVDMGRIILAYGQVRSAAFLRGQELRQFTEAGIPLVDELAKKFTELEGRVVSAGEVFEKISKREVSFGMVKDVLWQLTNEGGKFYNMQEVLTESLSGKLAKLKDSWEIMLSTIAESNNGALGGTLDVLTKLTEKWEEAWTIIKSLGAAFVTYKAALMLASATKAVMIRQEIAHTSAVNANTIAQYANNMAMTKANIGAVSLLTRIEKLKMAFASMGKAGWIGIVLSAIAAIIVKIASAEHEAGKLKRKLDEVADTTVKETRGAVAGFQMLVDKLKAVNDKYGETANRTKEYADIVSQINTSYGQYLTNLFDEAEAYDSIAASVKMVTQAIIEKKRNEQYEKSVSAIDEEYSGLLNDAKSSITERIGSVYEIGYRDAKKMAEVLVDMIEKGVDAEEAVKHMSKSFGKAYKTLMFERHDYTFGLENERIIKSDVAADYERLLKQRNKAIENLLHEMGGPRPYQAELDKIDESFSKEIDAAANDAKKLREIKIRRKEAYLSIYENKGLANSKYAAKLRSEIASLKKWGDQWVAVTEDVRDKVYADNKRNEHGKVVERFLETLLPNETDVNKGMLSSYIEKLASQWSSINEQLDKEVSRKTDISTESDLLSIRQLKDQKRYIEEFMKAIGLSTSILDKKKSRAVDYGGSKDPVLENLRERLKLLKDAHAEYKKWSGIEGHIAAMNRVKGSGIFDMLFNGDEPINLDDYIGEVEKIRNKIADAIQKTSTKDRREAYAEAVKIVMDIEYNLDKDTLEQVLKQSEYMIKEGVEKWNIFKSVRKKTGNESLAATLAFGQLNVGENEIMKKIRKQAEEKMSGREETFDILLSWDDKMLKQEGFASLVPLVNAYKEAQSELRKSTTDTLTDLIVKSRNYAAEVENIEREKNKKIKALQDNRKNLEKSGIDISSKIRQVEKNAEEKKGDVLFEQFKESEDWVHVFDDLDRVSSATLDDMIAKLEQFSRTQSLSVEDTKELVDAMKKLRNEQIERNPFKGISDSISELREWNKIRKNKKAGYNIKSSAFNTNTGRIEVKSYTDKEISDGEKSALDKLSDSVMGVINKFDALSNASSFLGEVFDNLGLDTGLSDIAGVMGSVSKGASTMHGLTSALGIAGPWGAIAGAALGAASGIAELHDKKIERIIEKSKQRVEALKSAYDQIGDSVERGVGGLRQSISLFEQLNMQALKANSSLSESYKAQYDVLKYGAEYYMNNLLSSYKEWSDMSTTSLIKIAKGNDFEKNTFYYGEMLGDLTAAGVGSNNLSNEMLKQREAQYVGLIEQRREIQEQLRLEEDEKKSDGDLIQDYQNQIAELNTQISVFVEDLTKELYGIDFSDWASQISDSIVNAFANGEDAAEAFKNTTNGIIKGVANKMLKTLVIEPMFDKLQKKLFGDDSAGGMFETFEDLQNNGEMLAAALGDFFRTEGSAMINASQEFLEALDKASGGAISATGQESSNGLSKGIQGVTEETSSLIASYLNSVRADVSFKRTLQEKFFNTDFPQLSAIAQAQLTQLNAIAANTDKNAQFAEEIYNLLHRNTLPGKGFKIG